MRIGPFRSAVLQFPFNFKPFKHHAKANVFRDKIMISISSLSAGRAKDRMSNVDEMDMDVNAGDDRAIFGLLCHRRVEAQRDKIRR